MKRVLLTTCAFALILLVPAASHGQKTQWPLLWGGSWYWTTNTPNGQIPSLTTFLIDGSVIGSDVSMFGGTMSNPYRYTPYHGTWVIIGRYSFAGTSLYLRFDPATNKLIGIARVRSEFAFGQDFDHISGKMRLDFLSCPTPSTCPNPLADDAAWAPFNPAPMPNDFTFQAVRIHRVPLD